MKKIRIIKITSRLFYIFFLLPFGCHSDYIASILKKYDIELILKENNILEYSPAGTDSVLFFQNNNLYQIKKGTKKKSIKLPVELSKKKIIGIELLNFDYVLNQNYIRIIYKEGGEISQLIYSYKYRRMEWVLIGKIKKIIKKNTAKIIGNILVFRDIKDSNKIYMYNINQGVFSEKNMLQEIILPFEIGNDVFPIGKDSIGFKKAGFENNGKGELSFVVLNLNTKKYITYTLPHYGFLSFCWLHDNDFICLELYAPEKMRLSKINIKTGEIEGLALNDFDREIFNLTKINKNSFDFLIHTGSEILGVSGRGEGDAIFQVNLDLFDS